MAKDMKMRDRLAARDGQALLSFGGGGAMGLSVPVFVGGKRDDDELGGLEVGPEEEESATVIASFWPERQWDAPPPWVQMK